MLAPLVLAASPSPSTAAGGDPRSSGAGPGLVGDPMAAILIVAAIAFVTVLATLVYLRATSAASDGKAAGGPTSGR